MKGKVLIVLLIILMGYSCSGDDGSYNVESSSQENFVYSGNYGPIVKEPITLKVFFTNGKNTLSGNEEIIQKLASDINLNILGTGNPNANPLDDYNLHAVDGFPSDIVGGVKTYDAAQNYATQGAFYPLNELADYMPNFQRYLSDPKNKEIKEAIEGKDGVYYIIPNINPPSDYIMAGTAMFIRTDWLEKLDLALPNTVEELETVLIAFRDKDPNGNGLSDEIPFVGNLNKSYTSLPTLFGARTHDKEPSNGKMVLKDNNIVHAWFTDDMKYAITEISRWYDERLIDPEFNTLQDNPLKLYFPNDIAGVTYEPLYWAGELNELPNMPENFALEGMLPVKNEISKTRMYNDERYINKGHGWGISRSSKNPEIAAAFLDIFFTSEGHDLIGFGIEGVHYDQIDTRYIFGRDMRVPHYIGEVADEIASGKTAINVIKSRGGRTAFGLENDYELGYGRLDLELPKAYEAFILYDEAKASGELVSGPYLPLLDSFMTEDERQVSYKIKGDLDSFVSEQYQIMITSRASDITDDMWSSYLAQAKKLGLDQLENIYNTGYKRYLAK